MLKPKTHWTCSRCDCIMPLRDSKNHICNPHDVERFLKLKYNMEKNYKKYRVIFEMSADTVVEAENEENAKDIALMDMDYNRLKIMSWEIVKINELPERGF